MARPPSLRGRLTWLLAGSVGAVLVLAVVALGIVLVHITEHLVVARLEHDTDTLVADLDESGALTAALPLVYRQVYSGHYFQVVRADGHVIRSRSLWDARLGIPTPRAGERWRGLQFGPGGQILLMVATGVARADGTAVVAVAEAVNGLLRVVVLSIVSIVAGGAVLGAAMVALQRRLLERQLRPLVRLEQDAGRLARGELIRLDTTNVPREVQPLADAVNGMAETLSRRLRRTRRSLGDLAHAMKTPLAGIAQLESSSSVRSDPATAQRLRRQVDRARQIIDAQLRRARLAGGSPGERVELCPQLADLLDTLERIHAERGVTGEMVVAERLCFAGDREDLLELLGAVLENAFRWAARRVCVTAAREDGDRLRLVVQDDGPGVPAERLGELTGRGRRLDESAPGSGLGLAVAAEIVEEYGGRLSFEAHGALGGLSVTLDLPAAGDT